jgi:cysteine sulfinate desulfinase/cysteine desulfurase-like protein
VNFSKIHEVRKKAKQLLEKAKRKVEKLIEPIR